MAPTFDDVRAVREQNPAWRLLRADSAPLLIAFLHRVFVAPNRRTIALAELAEMLEDELYEIRSIHGDDHFPRPAADYLADWATPERGWLRVTYNNDDEQLAALTPYAEQAIGWVVSLQGRSFIGTESRLIALFELLRQIVRGSETDPDVRIAELRAQRAELDTQIARIQQGDYEVMDDAALKDRFTQFERNAREFLADFRQVEDNFRTLSRDVREQIVTWDGPKGELLQQIFGDQDVITDSDEGKSFTAFWEFLLSPTRQDELTFMLQRALALPGITAMEPDPRIARIHYDWLEAGDHTQKTVAQLSSQLRGFLEDDARLENRRIMQLLKSIEESALALREVPASEVQRSVGMEVDGLRAETNLPMERKMYAVPINQEMPHDVRDADQSAIVTDALYNQVVVDLTKLTQNIRTLLRDKESVTLSEVIAAYPLEHGVAEIVGYLHLADAKNSLAATVDDSRREKLYWDASTPDHEIIRRAHSPEVIFVRSRQPERQEGTA